MRRGAVTKLPVDPGPAGWNSVLEPRPEHTTLDRDATADWVVIGAGYAGLAVARRLAQLCPTDRIMVLEARRVAEGPAGRNSGFMIDLPHDLASSDYGGSVAQDAILTEDNRHAISFASEMAAEYGMGTDIFCPSGKINAAATQKGDAHNRTYAAHLKALNEPHRFLDAKEMAQITGTSYYQSGLFTPGTVMIQPAAFVRRVADGLRSNRVHIHENSPVTALEKVSQGWQVTTPKAKISTPSVILAVNGHLNSFGYKNGRLMHVFTYASMTRPLTNEENTALGGDEVWGLTPADPMGTTVRKIASPQGTRIVIRNRFTFDPSLEVSDARVARIGRDHDRAFRSRFPMLREVSMQYRWGGRLCLSRNNVNVVEELEPGLFAACCQNGLGTTRGTLGGILAAELATGTASARLDRALSVSEPSKLPPQPVASLGAAAILKWQEMKAGREL